MEGNQRTNEWRFSQLSQLGKIRSVYCLLGCAVVRKRGEDLCANVLVLMKQGPTNQLMLVVSVLKKETQVHFRVRAVSLF